MTTPTTPTLEEKARALPASGIVKLMVEGLENPAVRIDMGTFGESRDGVCFGCAATNALCKLSGHVFTVQEIEWTDYRAKAIGASDGFVKLFEVAIDALRVGHLSRYNGYAELARIALIPQEFFGKNLPPLADNFTPAQLDEYRQFAARLEEAGK